MRAAVEDLECNLELLGLTGVEDKLQEQVSSTLATLRNAGVRVWMLTGATSQHTATHCNTLQHTGVRLWMLTGATSANQSCCIGRRWVMLHL